MLIPTTNQILCRLSPADIEKGRSAAYEAGRQLRLKVEERFWDVLNGVDERQPRCCPSCGSDSLEVTTLGILSGPDTNRAKCCGCDWDGIAEDLKAKELK